MEKTSKKYKLQNNTNFNKLNYTVLIMSFFGFFIGRVNIFHMLNPIAIAYLSCMLFKKTLFFPTLVFIILGLINNSKNIYISKYIICICLLTIINYLIKNNKIDKKYLYKPILGATCIFFAGSIISIINDFSKYYFFIAILEGMLTFFVTIILNKSIYYILNTKKAVITNEEIISASILISGIISGSSDLTINGFSFVFFFTNLILLFVSYSYGNTTGSLVSVLIGFLLFLTKSINIEFLLIFSLASIICGSLREYGKKLSTLAYFISSIVFGLIIDFSLINSSLIFSSLASCILFLILPCRLISTFSSNSPIFEESTTQVEKIKILAKDKLTSYAESFEKLSKVFHTMSNKNQDLNKTEITNIIDEVVCKVCTNCHMKNLCWEINFYSTYQSIFRILDFQEKEGYVDKNKIPQDFINTCINVHQFVDVLNKTFEIYKLNLMWKNKIIESRELIGQQLSGVSTVITELSNKISEDINFKQNKSSKIKAMLNQADIKTDNVILTEGKNGKYEVLLKAEPCYIPNRCTQKIIPIVNDILDKKMVRENYSCIVKNECNKRLCSIKLIEEQKFKISTFVLTEPKENSLESGDSHSFMNIADGNYLLALSDGMGSGKKAKLESSATIELLEDFLNAGFTKSIAINMINSALFLKSSDESFSTLDFCTIDLYTGFCEFIKIGAVSTFIMHKDKIDIIKSSSLPVGILNNIEPEIRKRKLSSNDIIIMLTDGIIDSKNRLLNKEEWIIDLLQNINTRNPEEIAKIIFEEAKKNYKGKIKDDISIMVSKIWESYT